MRALGSVLGGLLLASTAVACMGDVEGTAASDEAPGSIHWEQESVHSEGTNTHVWIVNRAIELLGQYRSLAAADAAYRLLSSSTCRTNWHQGIYDADYKAPHHDGRRDTSPTSSTWAIAWAGANWQSHFWDPDTGENYRGNRSPVAPQRSLEHLATADRKLMAGDVAGGCYYLGLSLHYMTDLTQPMHTANFAATDWPLKLHGNLEAYAFDIQDWYVRTEWSGPPSASPSTLLVQIARASKAQWYDMKSAVDQSYWARGGCDDIDEYYWDHPECWEGDPAVDQAVGQALWTAQDATARFIYAMDLPRL